MTGFVFFTFLLTIASHEYFLEYNSNFDIRLFEFVNDDHVAILKTMVQSYYLIEWLTVIIIITLFYAFFFHKWFISFLTRPNGITGSIFGSHALISSSVVVLFIFLGFLVSFGSLEAHDKSVKKFQSKILSASVIPGPIALHKATYEYKIKLRAYQSNLYDLTQVKQAIAYLSSMPLGSDIDRPFLKQTSGKFKLNEKPKHVFIIVMERYDSWPLNSKYESLNITNGLKKLLKNGIHFKNFLPGSTTTMPSLQTIMLGLPYINLEAQHFTDTIYPGAIAGQMSSLGYKPRFFYGGFLGWQQIGLVAQSQGFNEIHGADEQITEYEEKNEWGIDDGSLFSHVSKTVAKDPTPSFNLIMSSTNHPPYDLHLEKHQVPLKKIGEALDLFEVSNGTRSGNINRMGHFWYSDRAMTNFVVSMQSRYPDALFVITGDHFSRAHFNLGASLYEMSSVPFVLVGSESLTEIKYNPLQSGSHIDIAPTLIELIASPGHEYFSLGQSMIGFSHSEFSFGAEETILGERYIFTKGSSDTAETLGGVKTIVDADKISSAEDRFRALKIVTWWRMIHGKILE